VTKFHDSSTATISLLDFLAGHLLAKRHHHGAFFELRYGTAVLLVVRTTLRFARAASAILKPGFVEVVNHPCSRLASCLRKQVLINAVVSMGRLSRNVTLARFDRLQPNRSVLQEK
jgi:hypothetical protein